MTGTELKTIRENILKLTQGELAHELGVRRETINKWENGKQTMHFKYERAIITLKRLED